MKARHLKMLMQTLRSDAEQTVFSRVSKAGSIRVRELADLRSDANNLSQLSIY